MRVVMDEAIEYNLPLYLESTSDGQAFYEHLGFLVTAVEPIEYNSELEKITIIGMRWDPLGK